MSNDRRPITLNLTKREATDLWEGLESVVAARIGRSPEDRARAADLIRSVKARNEAETAESASDWPDDEPGESNGPEVDYAHVARLIMVAQEYPWSAKLQNWNNTTLSASLDQADGRSSNSGPVRNPAKGF